MATEDRFEAMVSAELHRNLGPAVGPHGQWVDAPAARTIAALALEPRRVRRWPRASLLLAAAFAVVLLSAAILVAGGITRPSLPLPLPTSGPLTAPTARPVDASPPPAAIVADPTPGDTPEPCESSWSFKGTASAKGLQDGVRTEELDGFSGSLVMVFGHPIDSVHGISIAPVKPPFVTSAGKTVKVAGSAFFKLTISGLNRPSDSAPDDMVAGVPVPVFTRTVASPITEMRRLRKPKLSFPVDGPSNNATEVWVIGVDQPSCLRVTTEHASGYGDELVGANAVVVGFDPIPAPLAPPTATPPAAVRSAPERAPLVVPLDYALGSDWRVLAAGPNLVEIAYSLGDRYSPTAIGGDPTVAIGVPYGYGSVAQVLEAFRSQRLPAADSHERVSTLCPEMATPRQMTVGGLTGQGFSCSSDLNVVVPLYPISREGQAAGVPAGPDHVDGWFVLKEGEDATSAVIDVGGRPVVITVFGHVTAARSNGPIIGLDPGVERFLEERLHLTFNP